MSSPRKPRRRQRVVAKIASDSDRPGPQLFTPDEIHQTALSAVDSLQLLGDAANSILQTADPLPGIVEILADAYGKLRGLPLHRASYALAPFAGVCHPAGYDLGGRREASAHAAVVHEGISCLQPEETIRGPIENLRGLRDLASTVCQQRLSRLGLTPSKPRPQPPVRLDVARRICGAVFSLPSEFDHAEERMLWFLHQLTLLDRLEWSEVCDDLRIERDIVTKSNAALPRVPTTRNQRLFLFVLARSNHPMPPKGVWRTLNAELPRHGVTEETIRADARALHDAGLITQASPRSPYFLTAHGRAHAPPVDNLAAVT